MGILTPAALSLLALAIPIIIFYMLRLRRQPLRVSSLLLWQKVLQDRRANAPWQRIQRNLLLFLQLLILLLVVLALMRPFRTVNAGVQGNVILLIDTSASMQATDVPPSRLDAAKDAAIGIIRALRPGDTVNLIAVADLPQPILSADATANRRELEAAVRDLPPTNTIANWETALALAAASAASLPNSTVVILSDGAIPPNLPVLPAPVRWETVGKDGDNQAIVALATRETRTGTELFVRVMNFAPQSAAQLLEIRVDDALFDVRNITLPAPPDGNLALTFDNLPADARVISAWLTGDDALALDNTAAIRRNFQGGTILLVSEGNLFLERALGLLPGLSVSQAVPGQLPADTPFDLMVFDRTVPDAIPVNAANLLFIAPPADTPLFTVGDVFSNTAILPAQTDHPLLAFTNFQAVNIAEAATVTAPWASPVLVARGGALLLAGETEGRRVAILTFDILKSDLPLNVDFPILVANLSRWLLHQSTAIPAISGDDALSANPLSPAESDIRPNRAEIRGTTAPNGEPEVGQQEFWWILAAGALAILLLEWWVYWRGNV